ncbi:MAG TPA: toll/interleukin-1 receptor domain-containing protein [Anaerolineales bacterium]|nr:toll/interleukin-1 receptor domain-containing protein [Anaerolineales bacterium]
MDWQAELTRENSSLRVFISHSSRDVAQARQLYRLLKSEGWMDVWFVETSLKVSQNWDAEIRSAVGNADVIIVFWSKNSPRREAYFYPNPNFVIEIYESSSPRDALIIPLRLDRSVISTDLNPERVIDYFPHARRGSINLELVKGLKKFAGEKGLSTERRVYNPEPEQGGQVWSSVRWREQWFMPDEEDIEQQEPRVGTGYRFLSRPARRRVEFARYFRSVHVSESGCSCHQPQLCRFSMCDV